MTVSADLVMMNGWTEITGAIVAAGWGNLIVIALHGPQVVFSSAACLLVARGRRSPWT
jgi:hypothetical protein